MKKILLLCLLVITSITQAQNQIITRPLQLNSVSKDTIGDSLTKILVRGEDRVIKNLSGEEIPVNITTTNYSPSDNTLGGNLKGIDDRFSQIVQTTAGQTNRIYFTGDVVTLSATNYYQSSLTGKGTSTGVLQTVMNDDEEKKFFTQDIISIAQSSTTIAPAGNYSGSLSVSVSNDNAKERFTIEVYKTNNSGTPIASGITGAPVGNLGVTVIAILDSGIIDLVANSVTNINLSGNLATPLTLNTGERVRYHVSAQKVGTSGNVFTFSVFYGSDYNSYYDSPVTTTTDGVINKSTVTGITSTDALNNLNSLKANDADVIHKTGNETKIGTLKTTGFSTDNGDFVNGTKTKTATASFYNNKIITTHADYGFLEDSDLNYASAGLQANASFNDNIKIIGIQDSDHHYSFQSYPHYGNTGLIASLGGFFMQPDVTAGTVTNLYEFEANNPLGSGIITNLVGLRIRELTRGANNWAVYTEGVTPSFFSGNTYFGSKVGIGGTIDPVSNLEVLDINQSASGDGNATIRTTDSQASDKGGFLTFGGSFSGTNRTVFGGISARKENSINGNIAGYLSLYYSSPTLGLVEGIRIDSSGFLKVNNLSGTGTRTVVADASGNFSATNTLNDISLTGTPTAPTAAPGTNTTQIATTAFVNTNTSSKADKTGTSDIRITDGLDPNYNTIYSTGSIVHKNASGNISFELKDTGASQGAFQLGTNTLWMRMRESGPREIVFNNPVIATPATVDTELATLGQVKSVDSVTYTVATLPTPTGTASRFAIVTDATAPTYLGTLTGGGSVVCPVFYNGSAWVSH